MVTYSVNKLKTIEFQRVNFMVCKLDFKKADFLKAIREQMIIQKKLLI